MVGTVLSRRRLIALVVIAVALGASANAAASDGAAVWRDAHCGTCHTLVAAGASGTAGPNLDQVSPTATDVVEHVMKGGGGMPSFARLGGLPIDSLAVYVASVAGRPVTTVPRAPAAKRLTRHPQARHAAAVARLQKELGRLGFFHGPVTGFYGPVTTAAVAKFQLSMGLAVDGRWGSKSQRALVRRLSTR